MSTVTSAGFSRAGRRRPPVIKTVKKLVVYVIDHDSKPSNTNAADTGSKRTDLGPEGLMNGSGESWECVLVGSQ